ncbi:Txe/YoeB family addiction module toxin [Paraburkholderia sediminicola]|uniref:Txe/YoeB family addiction module toxin n=1 Tax=Paraburkholderia sediminicola TaxID=458836 RepID=UPI0038BC1894
MARGVFFGPHAWESYLEWHTRDHAIFEKINDLVKDACRSPFRGIGKPEALKGDLRGWWSRRITDEHRLVYRATEEQIQILQCRFHYTK